MLLSDDIAKQVDRVSALLLDQGAMMSCAESCTGGMIAAVMTDRAGSSSVFDRGFVTYSNEAKQDMLDVPGWVLSTSGAVSRDCAAAMVRGAIAFSGADYAVAVTGIAGPAGGTDDKPVGLVYIAVMRRADAAPIVEENHFDGDRAAIRQATVSRALTLIEDRLRAG